VKVSAVADGVRVRMSGPEAETLSTLIADLVGALQPKALATDDPVYQRLFPNGYHDNPEAAEAFRSLTETSLRDERLGRAEQCLADLAAVHGRHKIDVTLGEDAAERWLRVLNDMRLAIGTRLGISEEDEESFDFRPDGPDSMQRAIYAYLTGVQDAVVRARMG
jgi:hypothetical protein